MIRMLRCVAALSLVLSLCSSTASAQSMLDPESAHLENGQSEPASGQDVTDGDPVILSTGNLHLEATDLRYPGRGGLDVEIKRTYRNGTSVESAIGPKWDLNWFKRIVVHYPNCETSPFRLYYFDGQTRIDVIETNLHTGEWEMALGYFAKIRFTDPVGGGFNPPSVQIRWADGTIYTFADVAKSQWVGGCTSSYWLSSVQDRMGNSVQLEYATVGSFPNQYKRLERILETYGRAIDFHYASSSPTAPLSSITDFLGRTLAYEHDALGRLAAVTTPAVEDVLSVSLGNGYPDGKTTHYTYLTDDTNSPQRFNVEQVIDPKGFVGLANVYSASTGPLDEGRVIAQQVGGTNESGVAAGGRYLFFYDFPSSPILHGPGNDDWSEFWRQRGRTLVVTPNGNVSLTVLDSGFGDFLTYRFTGRVDPLDPTLPAQAIDDLVDVVLDSEEALDPDSNSLRPSAPSYTTQVHGGSDPQAFITQKRRDLHGLITELRAPGRHYRYTYDDDYGTFGLPGSATPDRFQHGNVIKVEQLTSDEDDPSAPLVTLYAYEPIFNQLRAAVDPRGNALDFVPPNDSAPSATLNSPQRYMARFYFDYQELSWNSSAIQDDLLGSWDIDVDQEHQLGLLGIPALSALPNESNQGDLNRDGITLVPRGNVVRRVDPAVHSPVDIASADLSFTAQVRKHEYVYNAFSLLQASTDPNDHQTQYEYYPATTPSSGSPSAAAGGFLAQTISPEDVHESYEYDLLGNMTRRTNGRGFATTFAYNALDQLVRTTDPAGNAQVNLYDANGNIVEMRGTNRRPELGSSDGLPTGAFVDLPEITTLLRYDGMDNLVEEDHQAGPAHRLVTRHRYDKEGNRVLTLSPEWVAGNDSSNVHARAYDERGLLVSTTAGGLGEFLRDTSASNQAYSDVLAELGSSVSDLPLNEIAAELFDYDLAGDVVLHYDSQAGAWRSSYDGFGRRVFWSTPGAFGTPGVLYELTSYDPSGNPTSTTSQAGSGAILARTHRRFDEGGRVYQEDRELFSLGSGVTPAEGPFVPGDGMANRRFLLDPDGRLVQSVDDNREQRFYQYDDRERLTVVSDDLDLLGTAGYAVGYVYDKNDNVLRVDEVDRRASDGALLYFRSWSFFDVLDRRVASVDNLRNTQRFLYDSRSNTVFHSDADSADLSLLLPSLDSFGEHTALPNLAINGHGNAVVYEYDDADRLLTTRRFGDFASGRIDMAQTFDDNGRLLTQIDDKGNPTVYTYDSLDRLRTTTFGDQTVEQILTYDHMGRVKERLDQNGTRILCDYDGVGRVVGKTIFPGAAVAGAQGESETFQYDALGRLILASDSDSIVARFYDSLDSLVREDVTHQGLTRTMTSVHDGVGNPVALGYPGGRAVQRVYDDLSRLVAVRGDGLEFARYSYIGRSRVERKESYAPGVGLPGSTFTTMAYDGARRIKNVHHQRTADLATLDRRTLVYDRVNDKLSRKDEQSQVLHEYEYDAAYRMNASHRSVVGQPGHALERDVTYELDDVGNRLTVQIGPQVQGYSMNTSDAPVNQYTNIPASKKMFHDENGNLVRIKPPGPIVGQPGSNHTNQMTFEYDYKNRLVGLWNPDTQSEAEYAYDALDRRIRKTVNGVDTRLFYFGWQECEEEDAAGAPLATFVYGRGLDEILSMRRASGGGSPVDYVYHADDMGNVMKLSDALTGAIVESYDYDDYGSLLDGATLQPLSGGSSVGNSFFFNGRRLDPESGLYDYRHRFMSPLYGRFVSRDPIGIWGDAENLGNGFTYCGSNPWSRRDPLGLDPGTGNEPCGFPTPAGPFDWFWDEFNRDPATASRHSNPAKDDLQKRTKERQALGNKTTYGELNQARSKLFAAENDRQHVEDHRQAAEDQIEDDLGRDLTEAERKQLSDHFDSQVKRLTSEINELRRQLDGMLDTIYGMEGGRDGMTEAERAQFDRDYLVSGDEHARQDNRLRYDRNLNYQSTGPYEPSLPWAGPSVPFFFTKLVGKAVLRGLLRTIPEGMSRAPGTWTNLPGGAPLVGGGQPWVGP